MKFLLGIAVAALSTVYTLGLAALGGTAFALWYYGRDLPDYQALAGYEPPIVSRVYAADGKLIGEFASERRIFMPYAAVPERVRRAFISAEDQRFFDHPGLDVYGIARALRDSVVHGARLQGASTITQQVARNFFLTPERSIQRKLREAILAWRIERAYSKEKILELYLNQIFLGRQSYGVAAAAQAYFGKSLEELSIAEAAFLAALPQAPSRFDPVRNPRHALARRNYVLTRMVDDGVLSQAAADEAMAAPLGVKPRRPHIEPEAEYFVEEIRRDMLAKHGDDKMKAGGFVIRSTIDLRLQEMADKALRNGLVAYDRRHGWRGPLANIRTVRGRVDENWYDGWRRKVRAINMPAGAGDWQMAVVLEIDATGADIGIRDGGHGRIPLSELTWARRQGDVKMPPGKPAFKTATGPAVTKAGDVLRLGDVILVERVRGDAKKPVAADTYALRQIPEVTGALVAMDPHTGRVLAMSGGLSFHISQFNNATQAWRQPGSSFKPYVVLAALKERFTPTTVINDYPVTLTVGRQTYTPKNYSGQFYGPVTMRSALELSLNVATLRLAQATGLQKVADLAEALGVAEKVDPILSMPLGSIETTPLRHVTAYSMIVNGGKRVAPTLVDRIQDRYGKTIYRHDERPCTGCSGVQFASQRMPQFADTRAQALDADNAFQIVSLLQGAAQRSPAVQPLGKRVAGKTGSTNESVDAWFVGFHADLAVAVWIGFDKPRSLGKKETGSVAAAPIFATFMKDAMTIVPARDFVPPKGVVAVQTAAGKEFYKRGTEPGTGMGRELDHYAAKKTDPDAEVDDRAGIDADMPDDMRDRPRLSDERNSDRSRIPPTRPPRSYYGYHPDDDEHGDVERPDDRRRYAPGPGARRDAPPPEPGPVFRSPEPRSGLPSPERAPEAPRAALPRVSPPSLAPGAPPSSGGPGEIYHR